jgi:hypothetical protein
MMTKSLQMVEHKMVKPRKRPIITVTVNTVL